jgi:hypothetical protein
MPRSIGIGLGVNFGGAPVVAFSPLNLSPILWLDASDTSTITESGGAVSQWNDKSGNGYNVTQATGTDQPTTGTRTQNGLNVLDFDGSNDQLRSGNVVTQITTSKALTQFVVVKSDRTNAASEGIVGAQRSGNFDYQSGWLQERRTTFLALSIGVGASGGVSSYNAARFSDSSTSPMIYVLQISAGAGSKSAHVNATAKTLTTFDGTMATSSFLSSGSGNHTINIGNRGTITNNAFDGWIGEVLLYDSSLSDADRESVTDYLIDKWGI